MEISQYLDFDFLIRFLEGLQKFLGENSEILIHDYRKGYDHTIVYALNPRSADAMSAVLRRVE